MHSIWKGVSLRGVEGIAVRVEVQMTRGLPGLGLVGLAGAATRESRERVLGALRESGFSVPEGRVTVNLAPAEEPKEGTAFDLPMALGMLEVSGQIEVRRGREFWLLGELGLDGGLLPVRSALALGLAARSRGAEGLVLPRGNAEEARMIPGVEIGLASSLREAVDWVEGRAELGSPDRNLPLEPEREPQRRGALDLADVKGLPRVRRALAIAAAGRHNLLLIGSPGNGKSLMSRVLADLLPPLSESELREVMALRSIAGLPVGTDSSRPFRAPHHTVSVAGFVGSMSGRGRPGEISLAHRGLLFLDELPEYNRGVLEALREPLEDGEFVLSRGAGSLRWPAQFQFVAAMNPCPCGQCLRGAEFCRCTPAQTRRYLSRVSGPLLDRIDLLVEVGPWSSGGGAVRGESTAAVRESVARARAMLDEVPPIGLEESAWLDAQLDRDGGSFRVRAKLRSVAATLAALAGRERVERGDLLEAMEYVLQLRRRLEPGTRA